jgi:hypothetical protein
LQQPIFLLCHSLVVDILSKDAAKIPYLFEATLLNAEVTSTEAPTSDEF